MKCKDLTELLSAYADGEVDEPLRGDIEAHTRDCGSCRSRLAALRMLQDRMAESLKTPVESVDMRESVMSLLPRRVARHIWSQAWAWAVVMAVVIVTGAGVWLTQSAHIERDRHSQFAERVPMGSGSQPEPAGRTTKPSAPSAQTDTDHRSVHRNSGKISFAKGSDGVYLVRNLNAKTDDLPAGSIYRLPSRVGCSPDSGILKPCSPGALRSPLTLAGKTDTTVPEGGGISVLASSIGNEFTPEDLTRLVQQKKLSLVVVDWAWITYHWNHTNFTAVNKFLDLMAAAKVQVAAMYRPRFISNPTVPTQMTMEGKRDVDHAEICYSSAVARRWGIAWGEKILAKCPSFREIIVYNPLNQCRCPECTTASAKGAHTAVLAFLSEARLAWRARQPDVKLGVVYMPVTKFWKAAGETVDVAHPFLRVREDADIARDVADIQSVRLTMGEKMGSSLAKITWEESYRVSAAKLKKVDELARKNKIPYFLWTFETLLEAPPAPANVATAQPVSHASASAAVPAGDNPAAPLLERMAGTEPAGQQFKALNELTKMAKEADPETRRAMLELVIATMKDTSHPVYLRYQCCYVISGSGYEEGIPDLADVLRGDKSDTMRSVAAEALAKFTGNELAREALLEAARTDTNPRVREVLTRRLGKDIPQPEPVPESAVAAVAELAPSGPPVPPPGPGKPVDKPLPWPFPGDGKAQKIWNNYQQATDSYIHLGLDFIHDAGSPVTSVCSGYVAAIATNYPDWNTHHFFIVAPEKGGNRGWCYVHMDPRTFTFKEGDYVKQGQVLGKLVEFSVGGRPGTDHLHLHYVSFTRSASGKVDVHSLLDPLYFFDWKDTEPPTLQPLRVVADGTGQQFEPDSSGEVTVSGKVDILAAITDGAYPSHMGNLGVPVVMLSISDGKHTMQKLVLDHRGDPGAKSQTRPLYLSSEEKKAFTDPDNFPRYQFLRVTKTDGDGRIGPEDESECWDTSARDRTGKPLWPDGNYSVNVYAWDIAGNRGVTGVTVRVKNGR